MTPTRNVLFFHWTHFTHIQCSCFLGHSLHPHDALFSLSTPNIHTMFFFIIRHSLHPRNACSPLVTAYTYVCLVSGSHLSVFLCFFFYLRLDVSVNNICQVHCRLSWYVTCSPVSNCLNSSSAIASSKMALALDKQQILLWHKNFCPIPVDKLRLKSSIGPTI